MRKWSRYIVGVVTVTGLLVLVTHAGAETCTLELKRVEASTNSSSSDKSLSRIVGSTSSQSFFQQLGGPEGMIISPGQGDKPDFSEVIKKEPAEYVTKTPFRGVAELGSQHYGFVLDAAPPSEQEEGKEDEKSKPEDEKQGDQKKPKVEVVEFARLYFDRNHNGDLTDDEVIEATSSRIYSQTRSRSTFPTVELTIKAGGKKLDYAFRFRVYMNASTNFAYANASLNSAVYREGEITLDGKKRHVVLVDFNSNGRFDDASCVDERIRTSNGGVYPRRGDMLYIDPKPSAAYRNPYDPTSGRDQYLVGKLITIDDRFFNLEVDPSGETLSLEPSPAPVGHVTNPNKGFRAIVYGDQGMLEIAPDESGKAPLPEGEWKLLSYTILLPEEPKPAPEPEKAEEADKEEKETSILDALAHVLEAKKPVAKTPPRPRPTLVAARGTQDYKPVKVVKDKTVKMPFGPPYAPKVDTPTIRAGQTTVPLSMSLVGIGGEICSSLRVKGSQPSAPEFTISTPDGEEVAAGKFKYG